MFSDVVMGIEKKKFDDILDSQKYKNNCILDTDLTADNLKEIVSLYKALYLKEKGEEFPQDPKAQLLEAVKAVFRSWNNPRAITYRRLNDIPSSWGTAVNVQTMVFGNMGNDCGTGVGVYPQPFHRREEAIRRIPYERAGRGCSCGNPHARPYR